MDDIPLFDSPGAQLATIVTDGDTIKPILNVLDTVADETKLHITEDGIHARVCDRANVFMLNEFRVDADAFDTYDVEREGKIGVNVGDFKHMTRRARKYQDDELTISISERELATTVRRGYDNHNVVSQSETKLLDPASIRQSPNEIDLDLGAELEIDKPALVDAFDYATTAAASHVKVSVKAVNQHADALYIGGETDNTNESVAIDNVDSPVSTEAMYSGSYVKEILTGLQTVECDKVLVGLGEDYPAMFRVVGDDIPMTVEYAVAPRIKDD